MPLKLESTESPPSNLPTSEVHALLPQLRTLIDTAENARQTVLEGADERIRELKEAHRALSIIAHLDERYVIAVAGPQGTGKTTMLQALYGIPDEYLPTDLGIGEELPVLIVEQDKEEFEAIVHEYKDGNGLQERSIDAQACREIVGGPSPDDILVELRVPNRFFGSSSRGFLLLPGTEQVSTAYTELVEHVLPCASTAIVCIDETNMALERARTEIDDLHDDLEGAKELFALTKADQADDQNEELRDTVVDEFDLPSERRTISVANPPRRNSGEDYTAPPWATDLKDALGAYADIPQSHREAQSREIKDITFDVQDVISDINRKVKAAQVGTDQEIREILDEFDDQVERQREALEEKLEKALQVYSSHAARSATEEIEAENAPMQTLRKLFLDETLADRLDFQDLVKESWLNAGAYGPGIVIGQALNAVAQQHLPRRQPLAGPEIEDRGDDPRLTSRDRSPDSLFGSFVLREEDNGHAGTILVSQDTVDDVCLFLGIETEGEFTKPKASIRAVPAFALEATRFGFAGHVALSETNMSKGDLEQSVAAEFEKVRGGSKQFLGGVGAMLGLDALPDAEITIAKHLLEAAGVGSEAAAGIAGPAAVALVGTYGVVSVVNTINQRDIQRADAADAALNKVATHTKRNVLSVYDRRMDALRRRIQDVLRHEAGLHRAFTDRINLKKAGDDVDGQIREVRAKLPSSI